MHTMPRLGILNRKPSDESQERLSIGDSQTVISGIFVSAAMPKSKQTEKLGRVSVD